MPETWAKQRIDPDSLRGRLAVRIASVLNGAKDWPELPRLARERGLTPEQMLAAMVTEAVLEVVLEVVGKEKL